ncbi:MAG: hypothetical protein ISR76_02245 [Planctomycetes bacterium]|nr:hypothetical protein [Planctomycetota bacterium]MBL7007789.1 hypothetical protein [Planctomycetota bacterium]
MWRNILTGVAAVAICAGATAQQTHKVQSKEGVNVQYLGTYSFKDNAWSGSSRAGTRVLYNCTTPGNYYSNVGNGSATNADHLWIDEGKVADSNSAAIDQVNGFDFAYCSTDLDPSGNSSAIRIVFYDDYVPCTAPPAATCDYILTGLPLSSTGNTQCWGVGVDLEGGFECSTDLADMFDTTEAGVADRYFGWAFGANPGLTGMNNTGPILDLPCATPVVLNGCGSGNENFFYWEDPAAAWTGCYWFGGVPWASFSMKMVGGAMNSFAYGHANTTLGLSSTDFAAGTSVTFTVTGHGAGSALYLLAAPASGSTTLPAGELVISRTFYPGVPFAMNFATGSLAAGVPGAISIAYVQAAETTGPATPGALVAFSNGLYCLG